MKIRRRTIECDPHTVVDSKILRQWLGGFSAMKAYKTTIDITLFGIPVKRLYKYWWLQHTCLLHDPYPVSPWPSYTVPSVIWTYLDKYNLPEYAKTSIAMQKIHHY